MKIAIFIIHTILFISCTGESKSKIQIHGALSDIMHKGARKGVVQLSSVINDNNVYGLGAMENLDGEIIIVDSKIFIHQAKPNESPIILNEPGNEKALLLVSTKVKEWQTISMNKKIDDANIDAVIKVEAKKAGVNIEEPFPFIIKGVFSKLDWHIISPQSSGGSHDDHLAKSWKRKDTNMKGEILGFYSEKHRAVFTHHNRFTHMHVLYKSESLSGHVDGLRFEKGWQISFPK